MSILCIALFVRVRPGFPLVEYIAVRLRLTSTQISKGSVFFGAVELRKKLPQSYRAAHEHGAMHAAYDIMTGS